MKIQYRAKRVAPGVFELQYRRWLFWWFSVGDYSRPLDCVGGYKKVFYPKRFGSLDEVFKYVEKLTHEAAAK